MTNHVPLPDGPVTKGFYPTGDSWQAVTLDNGQLMVVTDNTTRQTCSLWARPTPSSEFQNRVYWHNGDVKQALNYIICYFSRDTFPEFTSWVRKVVPEEVLLDQLRRSFRHAHKSWQTLFIEAPILSLDDVVEWLQTTDMRKQANGSWLYVEEEYASGDLYRHRSLRLFDMAEDTDPYLLLVCRDYLDSDEDMVTTPIRSTSALKEFLAFDSATSLMLKALTNFNELERRLV